MNVQYKDEKKKDNCAYHYLLDRVALLVTDPPCANLVLLVYFQIQYVSDLECKNGKEHSVYYLAS